MLRKIECFNKHFMHVADVWTCICDLWTVLLLKTYTTTD